MEDEGELKNHRFSNKIKHTHKQPTAHQKLTSTAYIYKCWANNAYA